MPHHPSPVYTVPDLRAARIIVGFIITVGNNILHCVSAITTVVTTVLQQHLLFKLVDYTYILYSSCVLVLHR